MPSAATVSYTHLDVYKRQDTFLPRVTLSPIIAVLCTSRGTTTGGWKSSNTCANAAFALSTTICAIGASLTSDSTITAPAWPNAIC